MCGILSFKGKSADAELLSRSLKKLEHRGPDSMASINPAPDCFLGFVRLAINDVSSMGNQPFVDARTGFSIVCNGEVYNSDELRDQHPYPYASGSDCEVLLPLIQTQGLREACLKLDAEFAFVAYDPETDTVLAARDPIGIRPLFIGYTSDSSEIAFASEIKALSDWCERIEPFPPGHFWDGRKLRRYSDAAEFKKPVVRDVATAAKGIALHLEEAVKKRLQSDEPVGFLLSGGLDSSLVCALAAKNSEKPIKTFAVGCEIDAIDVAYAEQVAEHIGSDHTTVYFSIEDAISVLPEVIYHLESYDITTVRASIGMYLVCKYIKEKTNIKVLLSGEVSDELFGYKYTDYAPDPPAFQSEAKKRVRELYQYDVLRADRCISAHSLEARVPFSDARFVEHVMAIDPKLKMNTTGMGKFLLREAFSDTDLLPKSILYRDKAAFSDAVGHSVVDSVKEMAERRYSPAKVAIAPHLYDHVAPISAESLLYREIFEKFFPFRAELISGFWMPNSSWQGCDVQDPSARALSNYGASGSRADEVQNSEDEGYPDKAITG